VRAKPKTFGSDYGYTWPDVIQIKESVCHSDGMHLVAWGLCIKAAMPLVFGLTLTLPTSIFFLYFFQTYMLPLGVSVRFRLALS